VTTDVAPTAHESSEQSRLSHWLYEFKELLLHAVLQDRVLKRAYPGIMHILIFWGMTVQILGTIVNLLQYPLFTPFIIEWPLGTAYLGFEFIMDLAGIMILIGITMAVARRAFFKPSYLINRWEDWYILALLALITLLGFFSEAVRLMATNPAWRAFSPLGNLFALGLSSAGVIVAADAPIHGVLFWSHTIAGLVFVASLPFTKLRHIITGPINIVIRPDRPLGELEPIEDIENTEKLGAGEIDEFTTQPLLSFDTCVQCGRCESVCPSTNSGMPFSPRAILLDLQDSIHTNLIANKDVQLLGGTIDTATPWLCTTCGACLYACPLFIDPVSSIIDLRRYLTLTTGDVPAPVGETLMQMERRGNPWGLPAEERAPWAKELNVRVLEPGDETDILLFIGCAYGYDSRSQEAGRALCELLSQADVDFAILGTAEGCCGETARRLGHEYVFQVMVEENIAAFESVRFNRIISACAHCFNTLKNEYAHFGGAYEVLHHTEYIAELISEGKIECGAAPEDVTYTMHDSCYLGRYNEIYEEPRAALTSIPGLELDEMKLQRQDAFCCGGGGGHMWMEIDPNTRVNHRRLDQAMNETDADVIVTACPYCLIMFEDGIKSKGLSDQIATQDIAEVILATKSNRGRPQGVATDDGS
jgi:Fe-S oxidoreductase/nitrate reductase gamma subunit